MAEFDGCCQIGGVLGTADAIELAGGDRRTALIIGIVETTVRCRCWHATGSDGG